MSQTGKRCNKVSLITLFSTLIVLLVNPLTVLAEEKNIDGKKNKEISQEVDLTFEITESEYVYKIEERNDPFVPFFIGESSTGATVNPDEVVETKERLSGMQLFEPGQLSLVALLKVGGKYIAMVEDFKGQGYVLKEGMKIGRKGVIKSIKPNKVFIEEVSITRSGKELRTEIVMALRKEGEE